MTTEIDPNVLELIRCPVTKSPLTPATEAEIAELNHKIEQGTLFNRLGQAEKLSIDGGFFNEDRSLLLPVRDGIIILVSDQAICLN